MPLIKIYQFEVRPKGDFNPNHSFYLKIYAHSEKEVLERFEFAGKLNILRDLVILSEPKVIKSKMKQVDREHWYYLETKFLYDFKGDRAKFNEWRWNYES